MLYLMAKRNYSGKNDSYIDNLNGVEKKGNERSLDSVVGFMYISYMIYIYI